MKLNVFKFTPSNLIKFPYEQASCESGCVSRFTAFLTEPSQWSGELAKDFSDTETGRRDQP